MICLRNKSIIIVPFLGYFLFVCLQAYMQHYLEQQLQIQKTSLIDFSAILIKVYERSMKYAFFEIVIIGSVFWSIKRYIYYRKRYF
ncbi:hypothetical protein I2F27_11085 [Acinetobacter sp. B5B]|uniref:hypothetical protein n=1 Tax=Acinetobacter baretiae TaxID=2605383 RepID=UPI0018C22456|nr:hypothetical protein [Acinetobacter baretiae]MBF7683862.1 hypothetical protein [Acinetobacter baretiae]